INGGGGEIFRNFFYLLDRRYTIREILWSFYSRFNPATCTALFDSESYYSSLERKVINLLSTDEQWLPRPTVEWLYHSFRYRAWDGKVEKSLADTGSPPCHISKDRLPSRRARCRSIGKTTGPMKLSLFDGSIAGWLGIGRFTATILTDRHHLLVGFRITGLT